MAKEQTEGEGREPSPDQPQRRRIGGRIYSLKSGGWWHIGDKDRALPVSNGVQNIADKILGRFEASSRG